MIIFRPLLHHGVRKQIVSDLILDDFLACKERCRKFKASHAQGFPGFLDQTH